MPTPSLPSLAGSCLYPFSRLILSYLSPLGDMSDDRKETGIDEGEGMMKVGKDEDKECRSCLSLGPHILSFPFIPSSHLSYPSPISRELLTHEKPGNG